MSERAGLRVLIVEDSATLRHVCQQRLRDEGFDCTVAATGEQGYALLEDALTKGHGFRGLLLDWLLPRMSGAELMEKLMADARFVSLAIMIFTERPDDLAYRLVSRRPNNDIQLKEDLELLPYRMRKFLTTYAGFGSEGQAHWLEAPAHDLTRQGDGAILFVDDSPTVRAKYSDLLRNNGYTVRVAGSMPEALALAVRETPQLAIVDYFMPEGNGDELCRALLANPKTQDVTVVMHSQRKEVIEDALSAGAIDLIWKDDPINIFLMRVASIMRTLQANRQAKQLDILFAATEVLGVGVILKTARGYQAFNPIMAQFAADCGGLGVFADADLSRKLYHFTNLSGERRAFHLFSMALSQGDAAILVQDVTEMDKQTAELAAARDQAMESARLKAEFLANMSHEMRTPLNGVLGMLDLLGSTPLDEQQRQYLKVAAGSAESLLAVIGDVLDFSKIDAGKMELEHTAFDLYRLIEDTTESFTKAAIDKGLAMICRIAPAVPRRIEGDPTRLRQVLTNLLSNAIKFTRQGEVMLEARLETLAGDEATIRFDVADTGIGMKPEATERLFQAFTQADSTITREFGGTGLGLNISRELVRMMGGELRVESTYGKGSLFSFYVIVPRHFASPPDGHAAQPESAGTTSGQPLIGCRVLVAEDNAVNQAVVKGILEREGCRVCLVGDGAAALEALIRDRFDIVLMDCQMPLMDGLSASRELRRRESEAAAGTRRQPMIALTAHAMQGERERCLAAGMDDYLSKPIRSHDLVAMLQRWYPPQPILFEVKEDPLTILDEGTLDSLRDAVGEVEAILRVFAADLPRRLARLAEGMDRNDSACVEKEAHSIAGAAGTLGAHNLAACCRELEAQARVQRLDRDLGNQIQRAADAVLQYLQALATSPGRGAGTVQGHQMHQMCSAYKESSAR